MVLRITAGEWTCICVVAMHRKQLAGGVGFRQLHQGLLAVGNASVGKLPQVGPQVLFPAHTDDDATVPHLRIFGRGV